MVLLEDSTAHEASDPVSGVSGLFFIRCGVCCSDVVLIILRPILISILAVSNRNTLPSNPEVMITAAIIMAAAVIYLLYSIGKYFSFTRALGIDHFDESYRVMPLVREGIFRFTPNSMYVVGFLILWIPALLFSSVAALVIALFSHLYIWVHYFTVEKPDMIRIYGSS